MCKGLTKHWSAFGAVLILTAALSNSSCCSHRKVMESSRTETAEHATVSTQSERRSEEKQEGTLTRGTESQRVTVTEIEVYDTEKPADPVTGERPLKARIRQMHGEGRRSNETATMTAEGKTETTAEAKVERLDTQSDEVTVTATKAPSLWERAKVATQTAAAIMILAAAGWIIYKFKKRRKT